MRENLPSDAVAACFPLLQTGAPGPTPPTVEGLACASRVAIVNCRCLYAWDLKQEMLLFFRGTGKVSFDL